MSNEFTVDFNILDNSLDLFSILSGELIIKLIR